MKIQKKYYSISSKNYNELMKEILLLSIIILL